MRVILVHTLPQAITALEAAQGTGKPVTLQSPPDAIFYAGALYFLTLFRQAQAACPNVQAYFIFDCADAGGEAVGALTLGHKIIRSHAPEELRAKLKDIAAQCRAVVIDGPYEALDLQQVADTKGACRQWLEKTT